MGLPAQSHRHHHHPWRRHTGSSRRLHVDRSPQAAGRTLAPGSRRQPGVVIHDSRFAIHESAGIVLAGGRSTRMGTSKALLPFGPETMLQRVVRLLGTVVSPIVVVTAPGQELPALPADVIVTRDEREGRGPLEGLRAGLKALPPEVDAAYVTSCDVPLLVPEFVSEMMVLARGYDVAVMEIDGFPHPLSAVYRRRVITDVEDLLAHDRLRP